MIMLKPSTVCMCVSTDDRLHPVLSMRKKRMNRTQAEREKNRVFTNPTESMC